MRSIINHLLRLVIGTKSDADELDVGGALTAAIPLLILACFWAFGTGDREHFMCFFVLLILAIWIPIKWESLKSSLYPDENNPESRLNKKIERIRDSMLDEDEKAEAIKRARNEYALEVERGG